MNSDSEDYDDRAGSSGGMPLKPKLIMDEDAEEVTRKIAPAMIMPSLRPLPTMPSGMSSSPTFHASPLKASSALQKQQQTQQQTQQHGSSDSTNKPTPFSWKLSFVPVLPEFHPLERTATFVPNAMPAEVASRISDVLRERSIEAKYENGKAKVKCTTAEGVDFRIRLYRGRGRYNHGIIVEVQRRFGFSLNFHNETQAILKGAEREVPAPPAPLMAASGNTTTTTTTTTTLPQVSDGDDEDDENNYGATVAYPVPSAKSSLAMVAKMMKLPGFDSQYLGLQMLSPLVDSEKLSLSTARAVATSLFEEDCEVGEKVFEYVVKNTNSNSNNNNKSTSRTTKKPGVFDDDDDHNNPSMILRNASLSILANATKAHGTMPESLRETLRPALLRDLHDAETHPNTAFLAAKCLEYCIRDGRDHTELSTAFRVAYTAGESRHANLMHQAKKCMGINDGTIVR
jgi:hypothetical protein